MLSMYLMAVLGSLGIVVKYTSAIFFPYGRLWCEFYCNVNKQICKIWKTVYGAITQFMLFQESTTEKRSTVLSTSSENFNSDFILIVLTNKFINNLGRAGTK